MGPIEGLCGREFLLTFDTAFFVNDGLFFLGETEDSGHSLELRVTLLEDTEIANTEMFKGVPLAFAINRVVLSSKPVRPLLVIPECRFVLLESFIHRLDHRVLLISRASPEPIENLTLLTPVVNVFSGCSLTLTVVAVNEQLRLSRSLRSNLLICKTGIPILSDRTTIGIVENILIFDDRK